MKQIEQATSITLIAESQEDLDELREKYPDLMPVAAYGFQRSVRMPK